MRRWLVLFFAVLLPLQFAWSAASAYCEHEAGGQPAAHLGHHFHAHEGETKPPAAGSSAGADADCAGCHANCTPAMAVTPASRAFFSAALPTALRPLPPFTSAPARAPDRPQWLRLV